MTKDEIKNTPELVDYLLDESVIADSRKKLHKRMDEICNLAIKALEQQPCDDAISRQAVLKTQAKYAEHIGATKFWQMSDDIKALPPVISLPKTGHWMIDEDSTDRFFATYECSCCKRAIIVPHDAMKAVYKDYPYCHCGAKMREVEE